MLQVLFAFNSRLLLNLADYTHKYSFKCRTSTCNRVFLHCGIGAFTNLSMSSSTVKYRLGNDQMISSESTGL